MKILFNSRKGPSKIPFLGNIHQIRISNIYKQFEEWSNEYGDVFRFKIGPKKINVISNPDMMQEILKNRPDGFRRTKKMDDVFSELDIKGVFNAEGTDWGSQRAFIAKGLDVKHQLRYFSFILKSVDRLIEKWDAIDDENYKIHDDFLKFTFDVTSSLTFGQEINTLQEKGGEIKEYMQEIIPMLHKRINSPIPFWKLYKSKDDREFDKSRYGLNLYIDSLLEKVRCRLKENPQLKSNPNNILEALLVATEENDFITDKEVRSNLLTIMIAGVDTTAHALAWIIYFLCENPETQERARLECNALMGEDKKIESYVELGSLPIIDAIINETLRLKPGVPIFLESNKEVTVGDHIFKKGENIVILSKQACKQAENFSSPMDFKIERWLDEQKCPHDTHNTNAFVPFGSGPRFCPGKNLSMLEMRMVLTALLKNFKFSASSKKLTTKENNPFSMMPPKPFIVLTKIK